MSELLDITGDDIALLNDSDLRELIGRLCEADFRLAGLPTSGITWGGNQDAADGGIDVSVKSTSEPPQNSHIPRRLTQFQVKKPDMPRSKILNEMKPKGKLRSEIKELIDDKGAYIIVSSGGSATELTLTNRIAAMKEAIQDEHNSEQLCIDFFDRGRIATWVRSHSSLILWIRNKIGRPLQGWQPYANWANSSANMDEEFIVDEHVRLYDDSGKETGDSMSDGLQKIRVKLSIQGTSVRLVGLSGVGKTRFVQALFDKRLGDSALNPMLAHYTDMSDSPLPVPINFATQLVNSNSPAILIVDNCSQELHRKLTEVCTGTTISLITVEYDIRDDLPDETDVFRLEPASDELIEKLLQRRFSHISHINARTIADFASGNARVAIALANTLSKDEGISTLRDEDLFNRLFFQRHKPNENLRISAEICSLVYSFDGEDVDSNESELKLLATLAERTPRNLYRDIAELRRRQLIQSRSKWRAVLPHAIANRLAKSALESIPRQIIVKAFIRSKSERLLISFTRRLGYLHDSQTAIDIANDWLQPDGWLGETEGNFNTLGQAIFDNIAPIVPEATLAMLERIAKSKGINRLHNQERIRLLHHLAYDAELFIRSTRLLCEMALLEKPNTNDGSSARATLKRLFHLRLSGTQTLPQTRVKLISELINSASSEKQHLGIDLLDASLATHNFITFHTNSFGARSRDFGYEPQSVDDWVDWFSHFLNIGTAGALSDRPIAKQLKAVLSNHFMNIWSTFGMNMEHEFLDVIENSVIRIHAKQPWNEGWIAIKNELHHNATQMDLGTLIRLTKLEQLTRPRTLLEKARTYSLSVDPVFDFEEWGTTVQTTRTLGKDVAQSKQIFEALLPELVTNQGDLLIIFGEGLAEGCVNRHETWDIMYAQINNMLPTKPQISVLLGFLSACARLESNLYHQILDALIYDKHLGQHFVRFQTVAPIDKRGIERLHQILDNRTIPASSFDHLAYGYRHKSISDDDLVALMRKLLTREGGTNIVIQILNMRFHRRERESHIHSPSLIAISREVLIHHDYEKKEPVNKRIDHRLAQIARICMKGETGLQSATQLCNQLAQGFQKRQIYGSQHQRLLDALAQTQPYLFLDVFAECRGYIFGKNHAINTVPETIIIDWCEVDPSIRYPRTVSILQTYIDGQGEQPLHWQPIIYTIFEKAPNTDVVLEKLARNVLPRGYVSSSKVMTRYLNLFASLSKHLDAKVRDWAEGQHNRLQNAIKRQKEYEIMESQVRFERFE